jgi:hypothetical protein
MIDQMFKMMADWDPMGQAIFVLVILGMIGTFLTSMVRFCVIIVRGWPPNECCDGCEDDEEDEEDDCEEQ